MKQESCTRKVAGLRNGTGSSGFTSGSHVQSPSKKAECSALPSRAHNEGGGRRSLENETFCRGSGNTALTKEAIHGIARSHRQPNARFDRTLLDVPRAANLLGISPKTLRDWIQARRIEYVKVGTRVMLRPETIRQFVTANTRRAAG